MHIVRFEIRNYRAIKNISLTLNSSVTPIIGVNESGKTSILNAIMCLDKTRDRYNDGKHLEYSNNYSTVATADSKVSAVMTLSKSEIEVLANKVNAADPSEDNQRLLSKITTKTEFKLTRDLNSKNFIYDDLETPLSAKTTAAIRKYLESLFPYILYFDDFTDRVPEVIKIPEEYLTTKTVRKSKDSEWKEIIIEIFKRATTDSEGSNVDALSNYLTLDKKNTKTDILADIEDSLNREIIEEWKKIKKSGKALADDSDKLQLSITNEGFDFSFQVTDKSREDKRRTFRIDQRSKGFQWFFNYMIKLKFNPNYKDVMENTLFLLDEPGSYLHSMAQSELLNELKEVSKNNTIIFCTHSQYLLNPDVINLGSIRIASKNGSVVTLQEYGRYKEAKTTGALSPVYQALHLNFLPEFKGKIAITEGVTDFYLFRMIQSHTDFIKTDLRFIPGSGAGNSSNLISFALAFSDDFVVVLDNDKEGRKSRKRYVKEFGDCIETSLFLYCSDSEKFTLEDFFSDEDRQMLAKITNCEDPKRGIGLLYYDYPKEQEEFIKSVCKNSATHLQKCFGRFDYLYE